MNLEGQGSDAIGGFVEAVRGAAEDLVDAEKARLADLIHGVATALRHGGDELGAVVAGHAGDVADRVDHLSDRMRERSWREIVADLEDGARRRPELFLACAVAAGFLLGRVIAAPPRDGADRYPPRDGADH